MWRLWLRGCSRQDNDGKSVSKEQPTKKYYTSAKLKTPKATVLIQLNTCQHRATSQHLVQEHCPKTNTLFQKANTVSKGTLKIAINNYRIRKMEFTLGIIASRKISNYI